MKTFFIRPKDFLNYPSSFERQYIDYSKKEALKIYRETHPHFLLKEISVYKTPYFNI